VVELRPRAEEDVRVAMVAGYARVTRDSRVTRGTLETIALRIENPIRTRSAPGPMWWHRSRCGSGRTRPPARRARPSTSAVLLRPRSKSWNFVGLALLGPFLTRTLPCLYLLRTDFLTHFRACRQRNPSTIGVPHTDCACYSGVKRDACDWWCGRGRHPVPATGGMGTGRRNPNETAQASMTMGMIIGRRRILRPTQPPTARRITCWST
jgi:hypothetical protein